MSGQMRLGFDEPVRPHYLRPLIRQYETQRVEWHGIPVDIGWCADWSGGSFVDVYGHHLGHLEVRCKAPIPWVPTGYRSHFIAPAESVQDICEFVRETLDQALARERQPRKHGRIAAGEGR